MNISVIIPALNEGAGIGTALQQLEGMEGIEIIVSDGGSSDDTLEIAKKYSRVTTSEPGRGRQMNAGVSVATGDLFLFLHADTKLPDNWKDVVISAMSEDQAVCGAFSLGIDSKKNFHRIIAAAANIRTGITNIPYGDQGIFVRRSVFERIGGFREIPIMEDVDLMRRLKREGKVVIQREKAITSARRWEKEGVIYSTFRNWVLITLYYLGVQPERLYRFYKAVR